MSRDLFTRSEAGFDLGFVEEPTDAQVRAVVQFIRSPHARRESELSGRAAVVRAELPGFGQVVKKSYRRGGLLRYFVSSWYFGITKSRARLELEHMQRFREFGGHAPEPVCYVTQGRLLYRTWLITKEITSPHTLEQTSTLDPDHAARAVQNLVAQVELLIQHRLFHVDLHPGNVLVDADSEVHLVDFDKAHTFVGEPQRLRELYIRRWRRAVIKHELPDVLSELFCGGLLTRTDRAAVEGRV